MKFRTFVYFLLIFLCPDFVFAQGSLLYMAKPYQEAYEKGTRSKDGQPGPNYWQNTADYQIDVKVDPKTRLLEGLETVTYYNNSPDKLGFIILRLYGDVFREANPRATRVSPEDIGEGVKIKSLAINEQNYDIAGSYVQRTATNLSIRLLQELKPGESLKIECSWSQYIPLTNRRTGAADSSSFFVAYWYPQISVYDDVFGWDTEEYTLRTEFYNNLSNYEVTVQAPENFSVWASGELQNPSDIYPDKNLALYQKALNSEEPVQIISEEELASDYKNKSGTWVFKAEEVSDFAFALSDHYAWNAASQKVEGRSVLVSSVYPIGTPDAFAGMTAQQQKIMKHFSEDIPGIPYPYPRFTTFIGLQGGGMEFPMMAYNQASNLELEAHEMYHMYFPMYVRTNERKHAWMDEGWAEYITALVVQRYWGNSSTPLFPNYTTSVQGMVGAYEDLPLMTSSQFMDDSNYGYSAYPLPAFVYSMLHHELGDALFLKGYQEYIRSWAKKSPTPYDFFYTFERVSGKDLSWFWKPWFFELGYADIAIKSFDKGTLALENKGTRPVPLLVELTYQDGSEDSLYFKCGQWKSSKAIQVKIPRHQELKSLSVNTRVIDFSYLDNFYPSLADQVAKFPVPEDMYGRYLVDRYGFEMMIQKKGPLIYMEIPAANLNTYLIPQENGTFVSLDKGIFLNLQQENDVVEAFQASLKMFGVNIQGKKIK